MFSRIPRLAPAVIAAAIAVFAGPRAVAAPPNQSITANTFDDRDLNPACRADLNRDGALNAADLRLFVETRKAGSQGTIVTDINGDGDLDHRDLASLLELIADGAKPNPPTLLTPGSGQSVIAGRGMSRFVAGA